MTTRIAPAVAAGALILGAFSVAIASGFPQVQPDGKHGVLAYHHVNGHKTQQTPRGRLRIVRAVHPNGQVQFKAQGNGMISGAVQARPGRYRFDSFSRHCRHCGSQNPTAFGRRFARCSRNVRLKAKTTTSVRVRLHRKRPCTTRVRGPYRGD